MKYVMGIDSSTTGVKALITDEEGRIAGSGSASLSISFPKPLWSEQNPVDWWDAAQKAIRSAIRAADVRGEDIAAVGLTGQMHGLVMLDEHGDILRPAVLWNDQRTQAQCDEITDKIGAARLIALTGNRALTGFTAPKLLWVKENEPEIYARCKHVLLPKDYLRFKLTGEYVSEMSDASGMLLLNVAKREWSQDMLDALEIPASWLPRLVEGTGITGAVNAQAAEATGLSAGTPVVGGGGDQAAGAVGMGCVAPDRIGVTIGTSGVVFAPLTNYAYEPEGRLHAFCHAVPGQWHLMGVMLSAAGSLSWYRDTLAPDIAYEMLLLEAAVVPAGSEGLLFLPYLAGERTPHPDPNARGAFIGLTQRHTRGHLTRAVLEGVAFGLKDSFTLIANTGLPNQYQVRVSGGGAKSMIWQQIIADIFNAPLVNVSTTEGAAFGAAILAAVACGKHATVEAACAAMVQTGTRVEPSADTSVYAAEYQRYQRLYPMLKPLFTE